MTQTALITGASSGIGEEFARALSARGYDLILVARREDRLRDLAKELPSTAHVISCDLGNEAEALPGKVAGLGLDVDLLVNNAGFGTYGRFTEIDEGRDAEMVRVNCEAVVTLTRAFVPAMVKRGSGGVIVVASTAGLQPIPYEATYAASKAFALSFTEALHTELRGSGVKAMAVNPGPVPTEWQATAGDLDGTKRVPGAIPAAQVVEESLRAYDKGKRAIIPGRTIRWFLRATGPGPKATKLRVTEKIYRPDDPA
ncbi:MAG: SDR family oxidoreductase [Solirubrobacterales bacterium]|nr:SDR family oxidoreductase [Solirubrobacterales bacterium]